METDNLSFNMSGKYLIFYKIFSKIPFIVTIMTVVFVVILFSITNNIKMK